MTLAEQQAERAKLIARMRAINDAATTEKRSLKPEEDEEYRKTEADVDRLGEEIKAEQGKATRAAKLLALEEEVRETPKPAAKPNPGDGTQPAASETRDAKRVSSEAEVFRSYLRKEAWEQRASTLQVGLATKGGYLQPPQEFISEMLKNVDNAVFVRNLARKFSLPKAESLGVPTLDTDLTDATWTTELLTGDQDDIAVGKRELRPHPIAKLVKVSKTLSRQSAIGIDALVRNRMEYVFGVTMEKGYLTGTGFQQPLGIFTASADGVPTSRDISTDNTGTAVTFDGLINAKHNQKPQYWGGMRWAFHRDAIKQIRKLKDGQGQYLWQPAVGGAAGLPDRILDVPYDVSEYVPNTFTTGLYVGALCFWPAYWIADALDMTVEVLNELYALTNTVGFIGRMESDGMPVLAEAFTRVKLG